MDTPPTSMPERVRLDDEAQRDFWLQHFGVTLQQLEEALRAVGDDRADVREHLLNQGSSAGPG